MRKLIVLIALLFAPLIFGGAIISYDQVTQYIDGSSIPPELVSQIQYTAYYSDFPELSTMTKGNIAIDNLPIYAPDPERPGETHYYSLTASLNGAESAKCPPASKTLPPSVEPQPTPEKSPGCGWW